MATGRNSQISNPLEQPSYSRVNTHNSPLNGGDPRHDLIVKSLYRQQLDDLMRQKNQQKKAEMERERQEKQAYNDRLNYGKEAERLKDLSYKNYYQLLLNNQGSLSKNYTGLNAERDNLKEHLIQQGIEEEKRRSQKAYQMEQTRLQMDRKNYRAELDRQLNEKVLKNAHEREEKVKSQQNYQKISYSPHEVARMERERKMMEMSKYKEDLERTSPNKGEKTRILTGAQVVGKNSNDFNVYNEGHHNPMVNPLPHNIQNPYLLRQITRKERELGLNGSPSYSQPRTNNIFS